MDSDPLSNNTKAEYRPALSGKPYSPLRFL